MSHDLLSARLPGYRLHKVQIMNWGTLDSSKGQIHTVRPEGRTSLLIGQNGSGKSTLVDSILTLLVRPGVRNYNVAAGSTGRKRERDEQSYLLGAYGHASSDGENKASTLYLRKEGRHLSVLLAFFHNAGTGKGFTIAQVLYSGGDGRVEKVFCFAKGEKDIAVDFAEIKAVDQIGPKLEQRGFKTTRTFVQYHKWILNETKMRAKAMDVFNQTVAVKDIRSLTEFIRSHMLESYNWKDRIDDILNHFQQLSDAHRLLVESREQLEALQPVVAAGADYQRLRTELDRREGVERSCDCYFRVKTVELFTAAKAEREEERTGLNGEIEAIHGETERAEDELRRLQNDVENAGGERLRSLPFLIQRQEEESRQRRIRAEKYRQSLAAGGIRMGVDDESSFMTAQQQARDLRAAADREVEQLDKAKLESAMRSHELNRKREELEVELSALTQRSSNLPEFYLHLRRQMCRDLSLNYSELPFVAELVGVRAGGERWQSSIEMILRGFGLSLLVPGEAYREVSRYLNSNKLADAAGRGLKLVYHRVGEPQEEALRHWAALPEHSLLRRLEFQEESPLVPWVKSELAQRFDFRCCETIEEFQEQRAMAVTADRLVKFSPTRHEKDDRSRVADPRNFILGWDNAAKIDMLQDDLVEATMELQRVLVQAQQHGDRETMLRKRIEALQKVQEVRVFAEVDFAAVDRELSELLREKEDLENSDETVAALSRQLSGIAARKAELKRDQATSMKRLGVVENEIAQAEELLEAARRRIEEFRAGGEYEAHEAAFPAIEQDLRQAGAVITAETLFERETAFTAELRKALNRVRRELEPVEKTLLQSMSRFLRKFRNYEQDMREDPAYLEDFIRLHDRLEHEDLPRHEERFKERLNEKVTTELGLLNNQLNNEREEIQTRIETLNRCLETIDYDPVHGTFMQLEPKVVRDKEIEEFQSIMKACLLDVFDGASFDADEMRFKRIESMIERLRDDPRWREKVTDVRRWFDFGARETVRATGEERGYYSDSMGQSGGEKAKLAFTILVAAVVYQFDIDPEAATSDRFHFVVVDEMFSKIDDHYAEYAMKLFQKFGLQLLIVAPFDAKAKITEPFVDYYMHVVKKNNRSRTLTMSSVEFQERFGEGARREVEGAAGATVAVVPPPVPADWSRDGAGLMRGRGGGKGLEA